MQVLIHRLTTPLIFLALLGSTTIIEAGNYNSGMSQYMRRNYDTAREHLLKAIEEDPENGNAYYYLGEIEKDLKNYPEAIEYYIQALENRLNKKYVNLAYWNLIVLTEQRNDFKAMVRTCKVFYHKTGDPGAKSKDDSLINKMLWSNNEEAVESYNLGKEALLSGQKDEAAVHYADALRSDSSFLAARFETGMMAYKNNDTSEALRHFQIVADSIPFYTGVQLLTADIHMSQESWSNAARYYSNVLTYGFIDKNNRRSTLLKRGQCYLHTRRYQQAEEDIKASLELQESTKARFLLSTVYIQQRKYSEALEILDEIRRRKPSNPEIHYQIGSIHYRQRDESYIESFDKLYQLTRNHQNIPQKYMKAYLKLAEAAYAQDDHTKAAAVYSRISTDDLSYSQKISAATSFYNTRQYTHVKQILSPLSLTDRDKILLSKAYVQTGDATSARTIIQPLVLSSPMRNSIIDDPILGQTARQIIEDDKKQREEQERLREQERQEQERLRQQERDDEANPSEQMQ